MADTPATTTPQDPVQQALGAASNSKGTNQLANLQAAQLAAQVANWAAQLEFAKQRFTELEKPQFEFMTQMEKDKFAFQKATTAWQQAFEEASLSGTYNGVPTVQWLTQQAQLTGVLNGNQTLQGKLTDAQVAQMNAAMKIAQDQQLLEREKFGFSQTQWNAEFALSQAAQQMQYTGYTQSGAPTLPREVQMGQLMGYDQYGRPTLAGIGQQATITGYDQFGRPTLARQAQESSEAQAYLGLLANLRGPQNAFAQARVIGNTPNSIMDLARAWAGKYQLGGTTGSGQNPTPASVGGMLGVNGEPIMSGTPPIDANGYVFPHLAATPAGPPDLVTPPAPRDPYQEAAYVPFTPVPELPQPAAPTSAAPGQFIAIPRDTGPIPGRGMGDRTTWNAATQAAAAAWDAAHPGFLANGTQLGYGYTGPVPTDPLNFDFTQTIPGRGIPPTSWNPATIQAVRAWNAAHPGFEADGSDAGYHLSSQPLPPTMGTPVSLTGPRPGVVSPTPSTSYSEPAFYGEPANPAPMTPEPLPGQTPSAPAHSPDTAAAAASAYTPTATQQQPQSYLGAYQPPPQAFYTGSSAAGESVDYNAGYNAWLNATGQGNRAYGNDQAQRAYMDGLWNTWVSMPPAQRAQYAAQEQSTWNSRYPGTMISPPGTQAPMDWWNYTPTPSGQVQVHPPGVPAPQNYTQVSSKTPADPNDQSSWFKDLLPSQINARNYGNTNTYLQDLGWAAFEDQGWDVKAAQDSFRKSLPRYGGPAMGSFASMGR